MRKLTPAEWDADEAELRKLPDPVTRDALLKLNRAAREQAEALEHAESMRQGRPRDPEPRVQYVYDLVDQHRDLARKPSTLRRHADETKLAGMSEGRFRALVAEARKLHGLP